MYKERESELQPRNIYHRNSEKKLFTYADKFRGNPSKRTASLTTLVFKFFNLLRDSVASLKFPRNKGTVASLKARETCFIAFFGKFFGLYNVICA